MHVNIANWPVCKHCRLACLVKRHPSRQLTESRFAPSCSNNRRDRPRHSLAKARSASDLDSQLSQPEHDTAVSSAEPSSSWQDQHTHTGIAPDQPQAPKAPRPNRVAGLAVGLVALSGLAFGAFAAWKQHKDKQQRQNSPSPAPEWQSRHRPPARGPSARGPRELTEKKARRRKNILCRDFAATGTCKFGDRCRYSHEVVSEEERNNAVMRSSSRRTWGSSTDSLTESDTDEALGESSDAWSGPGRQAGSSFSSSDKQDRQVRKGMPSPWQTLHKTFTVPADQVHGIGKLMGTKGNRIKQITYDTGCAIVVPKGRRAGEEVLIEVYSDNLVDLEEALRIVAEAFVVVP